MGSVPPNDVANAIPVLFFGATLVLLAAAVSARWPRGGRAALWVAAVVNLLLVAWVTLSAGHGSPDGGAAINLTPLQEIQRAFESGQGAPLMNLVGNVVMFMPLGTLFALLARGNWAARITKATIWGLIISVAIEATQLGLGRVADVDDVILNTTGAFLGALIAPAVARAALALSPNYDKSAGL